MKSINAEVDHDDSKRNPRFSGGSKAAFTADDSFLIFQ
jgi:hypothetical protein